MFTWKILEISAKDGVITHARYHVTATQNDKSVETEGNWYFDCFRIDRFVISAKLNTYGNTIYISTKATGVHHV
jgi:hypothetical protein